MKTKLLSLLVLLGLLACGSKKEQHEHGGKGTSTYYTCSMDPQVIETKPGHCPICHMELTPISLEQLQAEGLKLSEEQVRLANIQTQTARYGYVRSEIFATGLVKENQNQLRFVNARLEGRIEKLYLKTKGATVKKGEVLYLLYSEMLAATQAEWIQNEKLLVKKPKDPLLLSVKESATNKLLLWGLTEQQIEHLKRVEQPHVPYPILSPVAGVVKTVNMAEGSTVMEGQKLFEISEYNSLWVEAQFYPNETPEIKQGNTVEVQVEGLDQPLEGKVVQLLSQLSPSSIASIVRIQIVLQGADVRPGMQAEVAWHKAGVKVLVIPSKAVLREAKGNTVWIKNKEGVYEPKTVHLGEVAGKNAEILHGLKEGEEVVVSGAYLLQSEYQFRKGKDVAAVHEGH